MLGELKKKGIKVSTRTDALSINLADDEELMS
jgi:hypothetical protein